MRRALVAVSGLALAASCAACGSASVGQGAAAPGAPATFVCTAAAHAKGEVMDDDQTTEVEATVRVVRHGSTGPAGVVHKTTHVRKRTEDIGPHERRVTYLVATETTWEDGKPKTADLPYAGHAYVVSSKDGVEEVKGDAPPEDLTSAVRANNASGDARDPIAEACEGDSMAVGAEVPNAQRFLEKMVAGDSDSVVDHVHLTLERVGKDARGVYGVFAFTLRLSKLVAQLVVTSNMKGTAEVRAEGAREDAMTLEGDIAYLPGLELLGEGALVEGKGRMHVKSTTEVDRPSLLEPGPTQ